MMGSCAFLMPVASARFVQKQAYSIQPALGLAIGGVPAVLLPRSIFESLDVTTVRWLVVVVVHHRRGDDAALSGEERIRRSS